MQSRLKKSTAFVRYLQYLQAKNMYNADCFYNALEAGKNLGMWRVPVLAFI